MQHEKSAGIQRYTVYRYKSSYSYDFAPHCTMCGHWLVHTESRSHITLSDVKLSKNDTTPHGDSLFFDTIIPYIAFSNVLELVAISTCTKCAVSTAVNGLPFNCIELLLIIIDKCITASASGQVESHKSFRVKFQQSLQRQVSS